MSNHHHVVLRVDAERAKGWSVEEVIEHWHKVYKGSFLSQRFTAGNELSRTEQKILMHHVAIWRERLTSISWFMRALNEQIVRMANLEDQCAGKFFESRFKSQALDGQGILAYMVYVDLNPIRTKLANIPEESEYTSM